MSDCYLGEIRIFSGNFAPVDWAFCDGSLLSIVEYQALYSLIGTTYGGNGVNSFALPDLRGRVPIHMGAGPGLTPRTIGQTVGVEAVTLNASNVPAHSHLVLAGGTPSSNAPSTSAYLADSSGFNLYSSATTPNGQMSGSAVSSAGGAGLPHDNIMPSLCINYIIALNGLFPARQ